MVLGKCKGVRKEASYRATSASLNMDNKSCFLYGQNLLAFFYNDLLIIIVGKKVPIEISFFL